VLTMGEPTVLPAGQKGPEAQQSISQLVSSKGDLGPWGDGRSAVSAKYREKGWEKGSVCTYPLA